ncbi:hypothetical protein HMPREF9069_00131 [Atopobium sp. oral taxon 810 str. F0209]|nr:hypothetical protein HMPREF9069_00131 [Atopobium sp. oral taxon 810 str. F0209]
MSMPTDSEKLRKTKSARIRLVLLVASGCWLALCVVLLAVEQLTGLILLIKIGVYLRETDLYFLTGLICAAWIIWGLITAWRRAIRKLSKVAIVLAWVMVIFGILIGTLAELFVRGGFSYHEFSSPSGKHILVVEESTFLLSGSMNFYKRENSLFIGRQFGSVPINDGFPTVSRGNYSVYWQNNVVTFVAFTDDNARQRVVSIDFDSGKQLENYEFSSDGSGNDIEGTDDNLAQQDNQINKGLVAIAHHYGNAKAEEKDITYSAKGVPKLVLNKDAKQITYVLYDRESNNGKCALYVVYKEELADSDTEPQIVDMLAYEYSTEKVISSGKHDWADTGSSEYRTATGE